MDDTWRSSLATKACHCSRIEELIFRTDNVHKTTWIMRSRLCVIPHESYKCPRPWNRSMKNLGIKQVIVRSRSVSATYRNLSLDKLKKSRLTVHAVLLSLTSIVINYICGRLIGVRVQCQHRILPTLSFFYDECPVAIAMRTEQTKKTSGVTTKQEQQKSAKRTQNN